MTPEERRLRNRVKYHVANALKDGRLIRQPCEVCGKPPGWYSWNGKEHNRYALVVAHHEDYSKPLEVRWLCRYHHAARHRELAS